MIRSGRGLVSMIAGLMVTGVLLSLSSAAVAEDAVQRDGKVESVTVYRGQALVTRLIEVPGPAGLREVIVGELPPQIVPGSLYAESDDAEVRSVRYRVRPVQEDVREEVRELDAKIQGVQDELNVAQKQLQLLQERRAYLTNLEKFTAETGKTEMSKGVLDANTLKEMTLFMFEQRAEIAKEELELGKQQRELQKDLNLLQRERSTITGSASRTAREAVLFVNVRGNGAALRLRYLVNGASW